MPRGRRAGQVAEERPHAHIERISHVAENYLLSLYLLREEGVRTTLSHLAAFLKRLPEGEVQGTTLSTVLGMVRRMEREEFVELTSDKEIRFTARGQVLAEDMVRRHRLAERMVVDLLGVDLHRAHIEAHRLEHAISPELQAKIIERLGNPKTCPFGRPIPGSGYDSSALHAITLDRCKVGVPYLVVRIPEEDQELLQFLVEHEVIPDREVVVRDAAPYRGVITVAVGGRELALGYEVATLLWVRAKPGDTGATP